jgi:hypothetical protein
MKPAAEYEAALHFVRTFTRRGSPTPTDEDRRLARAIARIKYDPKKPGGSESPGLDCEYYRLLRKELGIADQRTRQ